MKGLKGVLCAAAVFTAAVSMYVPAVAQTDYSIVVFGGEMFPSFSKWHDHFDQFGDTETDLPGFYYGAGFRYTVLKEHSFTVSFELFNTTGDVAFDEYDRGEEAGAVSRAMDWEFKQSAVGIEYMYLVPYSKGKFSPVFGAGTSYIFTEARSDHFVDDDLYGYINGRRWIEETSILAFHGFIGARYELIEDAFAYLRLRYRHTGEVVVPEYSIIYEQSTLPIGDVPYSFSGFDISFGVEVQLFR